MKTLSTDDSTPVPHTRNPSVSHLLLELEDAIHQCLGRRRTYTQLTKFKTNCGETLTSRNVDIHRHNAVATTDNRVAVVVVATTIGAAAHTDNPSGIGHLVINLAESGCLFCLSMYPLQSSHRTVGVRHGNDSQAILVISRSGEVHHLDGAASKTEGHGPQ
jgi:hypothetical protein